jgi:murein DD-endopeptidase MepM/ murein hydrolase activator NlpD
VTRLTARATLTVGVLVLVVAALAGVVLVSGFPAGLMGVPASPAAPTPSAGAPVAAASGFGASPNPESSASAAAGPSASAAQVTSPSPSPGPSSAPTSPVGFRARATIVPMGFPLPASARYRYGDGFRAARVGRAYWYNQIRGVSSSGRLLRAHDGLDLEVRLGTPVLATFDGVIVDAATIWRPWQPSIYGNVAVVQSTEPTSVGYRSISAHLSRLAVGIGDVVHRGQVIGWTGRTGNAAGTEPHLHFELRAPFLIDFHYAGVDRRLDVFDPGPSLRAADPKL